MVVVYRLIYMDGRWGKWQLCQRRRVERAWMTQSLESTALVEVVRAVRWVGGERGGPGEKEKEGRGNKRPEREVRR